MEHFPRPELARELVRGLSGETMLSDLSSGLFLTAPRRTGKTTFLRQDLIPELKARGITPVYADLWGHEQDDPAWVISQAIGLAMAPNLAGVSKGARAAGLKSAKVLGIEFDFDRIGEPQGRSFPEALRALISVVPGNRCALIVDEALHALTSEAGVFAMRALKSARDQLNSPGKPQLMLVFSGSDQDKLGRLVHGGTAPFYGSIVRPLAPLGEDFILAVLDRVAFERPEFAGIEQSQEAQKTLLRVFRNAQSRPQLLLRAVVEALSPFALPDETRSLLPGATGADEASETALLPATRFLERIAAYGAWLETAERAKIAQSFAAHSALEKALLATMLESGDAFRPFERATLQTCSSLVGRAVAKYEVQRALESLRDEAPPVVWKSARGDYAIYDGAMKGWWEDEGRAWYQRSIEDPAGDESDRKQGGLRVG